MGLLLSLFLLCYQAGDLQTSKMSAVDFSAVKQGMIEEDQGCIPLFSRQITFWIKNRSTKTIYIHGLKMKPGYYPLGYLIRLVKEENQWVDIQGNTSHRPYKEIVVHAPDVYVLRPGRSMTFKNLAEEIYLGSRVKRVSYISFSRDEEPQIIMSEEFTLR
jgi:hypothetical protein